MKNELWLNTLELLGMAWWIEVTTESPKCTYYFGPYVSADEAKTEQAGFIADLEGEGAQSIRATIKRCRPAQLTIEEETEADSSKASAPLSPTLSRQT